MPREYNHYFKSVEGLTHIDVYRVLQLFNVTDPCLQHAIKKLLVAGGRGIKAQMGMTVEKDVQEAIVSLQRWQEMQKEVPCSVAPAEKEPSLNNPIPRITELLLDVSVSVPMNTRR